MHKSFGLHEKIVSAMKRLGFTASDAKAYSALLKTNPATGYELAASSGVPRSAIYNVLRRLESLGLVNQVHGKPAKYVPLSPERLFELMEVRFGKTIEDLKASLRNLHPNAAEVVTWTSRGYNGMLEKAQSLIQNSKESVFASLWGREAERLAESFRHAHQGGAEVVAFSFTRLPAGIGRTLSYNIDEKDLERYWKHKVIIISDHKTALIGGADETEENRSVLTEELALVEMAISNLVLDVTLFGQRHGQDVKDVVTHLTRYLAPVEDLVERSMEKNGF